MKRLTNIIVMVLIVAAFSAVTTGDNRVLATRESEEFWPSWNDIKKTAGKVYTKAKKQIIDPIKKKVIDPIVDKAKELRRRFQKECHIYPDFSKYKCEHWRECAIVGSKCKDCCRKVPFLLAGPTGPSLKLACHGLCTKLSSDCGNRNEAKSSRKCLNGESFLKKSRYNLFIFLFFFLKKIPEKHFHHFTLI